jgi:hypothetical protein
MSIFRTSLRQTWQLQPNKISNPSKPLKINAEAGNM